MDHPHNIDKILRDYNPDQEELKLEEKAVNEVNASSKYIKKIYEEIIKNLQSDRKLRERFAYLIYGFLVGYCLIAFVIVFLVLFCEREMSDWPLAVLIGSTAVNGFSCLTALSNSIFKTKDKGEK